jgi:hypothetical protein
MANIFREFVVLKKLDKAQSISPKELPHQLSTTIETGSELPTLNSVPCIARKLS